MMVTRTFKLRPNPHLGWLMRCIVLWERAARDDKILLLLRA